MRASKERGGAAEEVGLFGRFVMFAGLLMGCEFCAWGQRYSTDDQEHGVGTLGLLAAWDHLVREHFCFSAAHFCSRCGCNLKWEMLFPAAGMQLSPGSSTPFHITEKHSRIALRFKPQHRLCSLPVPQFPHWV